MDTNLFGHLTSLLARIGSRRSAVGSLLGIAALGAAFETDAVKGPPERRGERTRRRKNKRKGNRRHPRAQGKTKPGNHCVTPSGVDLNALYGISAQIVNGFCAEVGSGEKWIAAGAPWFVNDTFEAVPAGFVPAGATPLEDFQAKFTALKLVIDRGTNKERAVVFTNSSDLFVGPIDAFPGFPADWVLISPMTLGTVHPLRVGKHAVEVFWVFSETHCDGVAANIDENCLPAGEVPYLTVEFAVTPGHH